MFSIPSGSRSCFWLKSHQRVWKPACSYLVNLWLLCRSTSIVKNHPSEMGLDSSTKHFTVSWMLSVFKYLVTEIFNQIESIEHSTINFHVPLDQFQQCLIFVQFHFFYTWTCSNDHYSHWGYFEAYPKWDTISFINLSLCSYKI